MNQTTPHGMTVRRAAERGRTDIGWLESAHSFSFGQYDDPEYTSFGSLRVLNDDIVKPGAGFGEHGHRDMEILTWVLEGTLAHGDSLGHHDQLVPGEMQVMSAGRGIRHSEFNGSKTEPVHFLQIWLMPDRNGHDPAYEQRAFDSTGRANRLQTLASPDGRIGSLKIHQDALVRVADVTEGAAIDIIVPEGRAGYLYVATGSVRIGSDLELWAGDAVRIDARGTHIVSGTPTGGQFLFFDLG